MKKNIYVLIQTKMRKRQRARRVNRCIEHDPNYTCFKPSGIARNKLQKVELLVDEYEAMRLCDVEWLSMKSGAEKMEVSASTFNRMVCSARRKMADAIVNGKGIRVYTSKEEIGEPHKKF